MKYHKSVNFTPNLFCYIWQGMGNNCNTSVITGVLKGDKPHVIVDPGHTINEAREGCFESLEEALHGDKIKIEDIGLIINTHSHPDHCQANEHDHRQKRSVGNNVQGRGRFQGHGR